MNKRVILISCVSKKLQIQARAEDLYVSTLYKLNLKYAKKLKPDNIFILSAKYGLVALDQVIEPYEKTLNTMSINEIKEWANQVLKKIKMYSSIEDTEFIFLAGERYRRYLIPNLKYVHIPLKGLGIGKQLQKLKELTQ